MNSQHPTRRKICARLSLAQVLLAALIGIVAMSPWVNAQTYEKVVSFTDMYEDAPSGGDNIGCSVSSMLEGPDGNIYGTTRYTSGDNFWGSGSGPGTIFKMTPNGILTTLMSFSQDPTDPKGDRGTLEVLGVDGRFYGLTRDGGAHGYGSVFRISRNGEFTVMRSFTGTSGNAPGNLPVVLFQAVDRNFYGVTANGGENDAGTVFRMNSLGGITTLVEFTGTDGSRPGRLPTRLLLGSDGLLHGITAEGGASNNGTLFKVSVTGDYHLVAEFTGGGGSHPGSRPVSVIEPQPGVLVGTAEAGGSSGNGVLFRISADGSWETVVEFNGSNGSKPVRDLVSSPEGVVFGMTDYGGHDDVGTFFKLNLNNHFEIIIDFLNYGYFSYEGLKTELLVLKNGDLIISTGGLGSGDSGYKSTGEIFHYRASGEISWIEEYYYDTESLSTNGANPECFLQASDGYIYGFNELGRFGQLEADGVIFRIPSDINNLEPLVWLGIPSREPAPAGAMSGICEANNGLFYGTSHTGGKFDVGAMYSLSPAGICELVHSFTGNSNSVVDDADGLYPSAGLVVGADGDLFGFTEFLLRGQILPEINEAVAYRVSRQGSFKWKESLISEEWINSQPPLDWHPRGGAVMNPEGLMFRPAYRNSLMRFDPEGNINYLAGFLPLVPFSYFQNHYDYQGHASSGPLLADGYDLYGTFAAGGDHGDGIIYRTHSVTGSPEVLASLDDLNPLDVLDLWTNQAVTPRGATSDPTFEIAFTMRTDEWHLYPVDGVVGLSFGPAASYNHLACSIRFFTNNRIEVRNGENYQDAGIGFARQRDYRVTMRINLAAKTYSVLVDGVEVATDCTFRTEQAGLATINNVGMICEVGKMTVSDISSAILPLQGKRPLARLTKGGDENFYGTASEGGAHGHGTIFRMAPSGVLTKLVDFTGADGPFKGKHPASAILEHDGWFYGTTNKGGEADLGTVFRISTDGLVFESLFDFMDDNLDSVPMGDLTLGSDGNLYGTTHGSGSGRGSVYRLVLPGVPVIYPLPVEMTGNTSVELQTKINPRGNTAAIWLDYGTDGVNFTSQQLMSALGNWRTFDLGTTLTDLAPGTTYVYRFRAVYAGGTIVGPLDSFDTIGLPVVLAENPSGVTRNTATLHGTARAGNATSFLTFEYGTDGNTFPFAVVPTPVFATGSNETQVSVAVNLEAGTTYYYRLTASNSAGTSVSGVRTFTTLADPEVTVGGAFAVGTTSARLEGTVNARESEGVNVAFEYGIGETVLGTVTATPAVVGGSDDKPVEAVLSNLLQGTEYFYRVKATAPGLLGVSETETFTMDVLSGFQQAFPGAPPPSDGFLFVMLSPSGVGNWRFVGEQQWRASGVPAGGLTTGDRDIEFRPVAGYIHPPRETVSVVSGEAARFVECDYFETASAGSGGLTVVLKPDSITTGEGRARWRLLGEDDTKWRDSDVSLSGLAAGTHLVECLEVDGRSAPPPAEVRIVAGETRVLTLTYFQNEETSGSLPVELTFSAVSGDQNMPYAHVGQIRSAVGAGTGFVVKPRVVATAAHVVWDDGTLAAAPGVRWLFQQHRGIHEARPVIPRGFHMLTGYASARSAPGVQPGEGTPESQNLDVAALYFSGYAGRGGFSGFLASDLPDNEFLLSDSQKLLAGYPLNGIAAGSRDRMHATAPTNLAFERVNGRVFRTTGIRSFGGNSGGPLCVFFEGDPYQAYYPAAIYLGGSDQTLVRAIDREVAALFTAAEASSSEDDNGTGDGVSHIVYSADSHPEDLGALKVIIEPAAAVEGGARWRFAGETNWRLSGSQRNNLTAGAYLIEFLAMDGYTTPSQQAAVVTGGVVATLTVPYQAVANSLEQWRSQYFGASPDPTTSADDADPDGDGVRNIDEYIAGTNPLDASDRFAILTAEKGPAGFSVSAAGKTGRRYTLQRRESPAGGTWDALTSLGPLSTDGPVTLTDPAPPSERAFYRLGVSFP